MVNESTLLNALRERILVFDGAMGTNIHRRELSLRDYDGHENCIEILNLTRTDVILDIHRSFLAVACDAVQTNTFGGSKLVLGEFGLGGQTYEINKRGAEIARQAVNEFMRLSPTSGTSFVRPRWVIGSIGPGTRLPSLLQTSWNELVGSYLEQSRGLLDGGADALLI